MNGLTPENALRMAQLCAGVQQRLLQLAQAETTETPESDT